MWLRANIVLVVAVVFALIQMFASATGGPRITGSDTVFDAVTKTINRSIPSVAAQDDNDEDDDDDNEDDDDDEDNDDEDEDDENDEDDDEDNSDNEDDEDNSDDEDSDNDEDNDDDDSDNDEDDDDDNDEASSDDDVIIDNIDPSTAAAAAAATPTATTTTAATAAGTTATTASTASAPAASQPAANAVSPAASPSPAPQVVREVTVVTTGVDAPLALSDRITVQLFAALPAGTSVTLRMVDPLTYPATPGIRAGDLIFQIEAKDASGAALTALPAEVNLTVRYADVDVLGLTEANITMARLDTATNTWTTAPKLVTDPATNVLSASITDLGVFAVYVP